MCATRNASRIPPDFASLMLTPWPSSAQAATSASDVAVLVEEDRDRRAIAPEDASRPRRPSGERLLAVGDAERGELRQRLECLVGGPGAH